VSPTGVIEIRGLRVLGSHGVREEERAVPQPFELDLEVGVDTALAASSDEVADTVDYGVIAAEVEALVSTSSFKLLESIAEAVVAKVLSHEAVEEVTVVVRKLRPPVPVDLASAGVRVTRSRTD
jgi:FolB domain-containing protein